VEFRGGVDWLPNSPALNPIENMWPMLKTVSRERREVIASILRSMQELRRNERLGYGEQDD
jgi:hypothetical protein